MKKFKLLLKLCVLWSSVFLITIFPLAALAQSNASLSAHSAVQDERINGVVKKVEDQSQLITKLQIDLNEMQRDVYMWKGAVVGFGAFVSFLEVLQALGALGREKNKRP